MQQTRQPFHGGFLVPQAPRPGGLVAGLFVNKRAHKGGAPLAVLPRCPGEHSCDLVLQASRVRVLVRPTPRLSRGYPRGYSPSKDCVLTSETARRIDGRFKLPKEG